MINKIKEYIKSNNLIEPSSKVVVALSGGIDSSVLFHIIKNLGYDIVIAHVNHKIRLESEIEEEYIKELCEGNNIPLEIMHLEKIDKNFEATAHEKRYEFFINVCKKYNSKYLLTAHHADDNIETIFLNLMSGSNLYGYGGISKSLEIDGIKIVRPLLLISKEEIKKYALKNNIKYFEDYTNQSDDYTRNRIRHHIIPKLKEECPNILDKANSFSRQIHDAFNFIRSESIKFLNDNKINIEKFKDLNQFLQKDIICLLLENYMIERNENLINDILNIILCNKPQLDYSLKENFVFKKRYIVGFIDKKISSNSFHYEIKSFNDRIENNKFHIYLTNDKPKDAVYLKLCYNEIVFPLVVRNRKNGDEILLSYGHKKLKDLFIDQKIKKETRDEIPIITDGNNNILWIYNIKKSSLVTKYNDSFDCYLAIEVK